MFSYAYSAERVLSWLWKKIPVDLVAEHKCSCKHAICIVQLEQRDFWADNELYCFLK